MKECIEIQNCPSMGGWLAETLFTYCVQQSISQILRFDSLEEKSRRPVLNRFHDWDRQLLLAPQN
jgi:hypothetical protein